MYTVKVLSGNACGASKIEVGIFTRVNIQHGDGVFQDDIQIGQYQRNYSLLHTFYPFTLDGQDYALYSPDYESTRILKLPECQDIGGEPEDESYFCPVSYYVPTYIRTIYKSKNDGKLMTVYHNNPDDGEIKRITSEDSHTYEQVDPLKYYSFGFVAGCIWGDDSSWKIEYLDLSQVDQGILHRKPVFGYHQLPAFISLDQAINMRTYNPEDECFHIALARETYYDISNPDVVGRLEYD